MSKLKAEPRIKDPNPKRTAANWAYIQRCEAHRKKREAKIRKVSQ